MAQAIGIRVCRRVAVEKPHDSLEFVLSRFFGVEPLGRGLALDPAGQPSAYD